MFEVIKNDWTNGTFWDKAFIVFVIVIFALAITFVVQHIQGNPKKRLKFIAKAQEKNCMTVGKLTCLTLHGFGGPENYHVEYMYVVDGKCYFVTYEMQHLLNVDDKNDDVNADILLLKFKPALILFYDEKDPSKVMSKPEVFVSYHGMHQIATPKNNIWRDTEKEWTDAINLVRY